MLENAMIGRGRQRVEDFLRRQGVRILKTTGSLTRERNSDGELVPSRASLRQYLDVQSASGPASRRRPTTMADKRRHLAELERERLTRRT